MLKASWRSCSCFEGVCLVPIAAFGQLPIEHYQSINHKTGSACGCIGCEMCYDMIVSMMACHTGFPTARTSMRLSTSHYYLVFWKCSAFTGSCAANRVCDLLFANDTHLPCGPHGVHHGSNTCRKAYAMETYAATGGNGRSLPEWARRGALACDSSAVTNLARDAWATVWAAAPQQHLECVAPNVAAGLRGLGRPAE